MANFTKFLQLLKKDPVADANDTFNIQTMLNENWDKIDAAMDKTIFAAVASMGADGGLDGTELLSVTPFDYIGVKNTDKDATDYALRTATLSIDLSGFPDSARIGYIGGLGIATSWARANNTMSPDIGFTFSIAVNDEVIDGLTSSHPAKSYHYNASFPVPHWPDMNIAAVFGRPLTNADTLRIMVTTEAFSVGAWYAYTVSENIDALYVRYLEV